MVSIIIFGVTALASLSSVKTIGTTFFSATVGVMWKKKRQYENNFKTGLNPELLKKGIRPPIEEFQSFTLLKEDLPKELHFLAHSWILTRDEEISLFHAMRRHCQIENIGEEGRAIRDFCERHNASFTELGHLVLSGRDLQPVSRELAFYSENRLKDPSFTSLLGASKKLN